jgi:hypothetical protein
MTTSDADLLHPLWAALRRRLEARRRPIQEEIRRYPPPIPACDAHFNHLLEQRSALSREIVRLDAASREAAGDIGTAVSAFIEKCPYLDGEEKQEFLEACGG